MSCSDSLEIAKIRIQIWNGFMTWICIFDIPHEESQGHMLFAEGRTHEGRRPNRVNDREKRPRRRMIWNDIGTAQNFWDTKEVMFVICMYSCIKTGVAPWWGRERKKKKGIQPLQRLNSSCILAALSEEPPTKPPDLLRLLNIKAISFFSYVPSSNDYLFLGNTISWAHP